MALLSLQAAKNSWDILLLQEPLVGNNKLREIPAHWQNWISRNNKAAIVLTNKNIIGGVFAILDNCVAIKVSTHKEEVTFVSAYSSPSQKLEDTILELNFICNKAKSSPIFISADLNAHHQSWGYKDINARGWTLLDFTRANHLIFHNDKSTTYEHYGATGAPDVSLSNSLPPLDNIHWHVRKEDVTHSPHFFIEISIHESPTLNFTTKFSNSRRRILRFLDALQENFGAHELDIREAQDRHHLDLATNRLFDTITSKGNKFLRVSRARKNYFDNWWCKELEVARRKTRASKKKFLRANDDNREVLRIIFHRNRAIYSKLIRKYKKNSWEKFCTLATDPFGTFYKATVKHSSFSPQIFVSPDQNLSIREQAKLQLQHFFPNDSENHQDSSSDSTRQNFHQNVFYPDTNEISFGEVWRIASFLNKKKAPGIDAVNNVVLQALLKRFPTIFTLLFNKCIQLSYFPRHFKKSHVLFFLKKDRDPSYASSYRPIHLLSTIGKLLEKVICQRISYYLDKSNVLSPYQFGFRHGRSTEQAMMAIKNEILCQKSKRHNIAIITLDIQGAFDNINHNIITSQLHNLPIPTNLADMMTSILSDRTVQIDTPEGPVLHTITKGCPQGSCSGPLLWNIFINDLLQQNWPKNVKVQAYADDLIVIVSGPAVERTGTTATITLNSINTWLQQRDLKIAAEKTSFLWISSKRPPSIKIGDQFIKKKSQVKILGVIFDDQLNWYGHIAEISNKINALLPKLWCSAGKNWGINMQMRRTLYLAVAQRIIVYGAVIWGAHLTEEQGRRIDSIQRGCLLYILKAYSTSPTNALQVVTGLPPLRLFVEFEAKKGLLCRNKTNIQLQNGTFVGHLQLQSNVTGWTEHPAISPTDVQISTISSEDRITSVDDEISIYTDGSKTESGVAAAFVIYKANDILFRWSCKLHNNNTVFQSELFAIYMACRKAMELGGKTTIFSDSLSSLHAVKDPLSRHLVARQVRSSLCASPNISLAWIKAHTGTRGNEEADIMAKSTTERESSDFSLFLPKSWATGILKNEMMDKWQYRWSNERKTGRKIFALIPTVKAKLRRWTREMFLFFSEHGPFPSYLARFHRRTDKCRCGEEGTVLHYATSCPLTKAYHVSSPPVNVHQWKLHLLGNQEFHRKINKLINYIENNEDHIIVPRPNGAQNRNEMQDSCSDSDYEP